MRYRFAFTMQTPSGATARTQEKYVNADDMTQAVAMVLLALKATQTEKIELIYLYIEKEI